MVNSAILPVRSSGLKTSSRNFSALKLLFTQAIWSSSTKPVQNVANDNHYAQLICVSIERNIFYTQKKTGDVFWDAPILETFYQFGRYLNQSNWNSLRTFCSQKLFFWFNSKHICKWTLPIYHLNNINVLNYNFSLHRRIYQFWTL